MRRFAHSVLVCPLMTAAHRIMHCVLQVIFCALSFVRRGSCQTTSLVPDSSMVRLPRSDNVKELRTPQPQLFQCLNPRSKLPAPCKPALHARAIDTICHGACPWGEHGAAEHLPGGVDRSWAAAEREGANTAELVAKAGHDHRRSIISGGLKRRLWQLMRVYRSPGDYNWLCERWSLLAT